MPFISVRIIYSGIRGIGISNPEDRDQARVYESIIGKYEPYLYGKI